MAKELRAFKIAIQGLFDQGKFADADKLYSLSKLISLNDYHEIKSYDGITSWLKSHENYEIDDDKAVILGHTGKSILVKARAGSGKTKLLELKTLMAVKTENIKPDEVMILAFNRLAKEEIKTRIQKKIPDFSNSRTFHSLAYSIVNPSGDILKDDADSLSARQNRRIFVQEVLEKHLSHDLVQSFYNMYRNTEVDNLTEKSEIDKYEERKSKIRPYVTLKGEKVKSRAEKYIADFLFERDIDYRYEKFSFFLKGTIPYRPDFTLWSYTEDSVSEKIKFIWEHWGYENKKYREFRDEKRRYCKDQNIPLIETYNDDLYKKSFSRIDFEEYLERVLKKHKVVFSKRDENYLLDKFISQQENSVIKLISNFITRVKQRVLSIEEFEKKYNLYKPSNLRESIFLPVASFVYKSYEEHLKKDQIQDFEKILKEATDCIHQKKGDISVKCDKNETNLNDLKYLLIDEYQDFSPLFYQLIKAIRTYNPHLKLLCVGDDWQAINGFAGADLNLFKNFRTMFNDGIELPLSTNYRCKQNIVDFSNRLMVDKGTPAKPHKKAFIDKGHIFRVISHKEHIELRRFQKSFKKDSSLFINLNGQSQRHGESLSNAKFMKTLSEIIVAHPGSEIALLSRTEKIGNESQENWLSRLKRYIYDNFDKSQYPKSLSISTIHKYKGKEADVVFLLNANERIFPLIHPDNELLRFTGLTEEEEYEAELRLFYVAVTRAKSFLYLVHDENKASPFFSHHSIQEYSKDNRPEGRVKIKRPTVK